MLTIERRILGAGAFTQVDRPDSSLLQVAVMNNAGTDLLVFGGNAADESDLTKSLTVPDGMERLLRFSGQPSNQRFFFLFCAAGGEVVLVWG